MNEHETNPQRHESSSASGQEPSHQPGDASHAGNSPERGTSDTTMQQGVPPTAALPAAAPAAPAAGYGQPGLPAQPQYQAQQPPGQWLGSPWQRGGQQAPHSGYQQQQSPFGHYAAQPGQPGQPQPGAEGQQAWNGSPVWATSVGTEQRDPAPRTPGRGRKIFVAGAAALAIALASGGIGAATALAVSDNGGTSAVTTSNSSVSRVVDRSSLAEIVTSVKDSVVSITTETGEGSGVVLTADGYIVTNNHVVSTAQGDTVTVVFADGTKKSATITGTDERTDLAVIKVTGVSDLKVATLGSSANMQVGDTVLAIGSPLGLEGSVTEGIISAKDRTIQSSSEEEQQQTPTNPFGGQQQQQQQSQSSGSTTMSGLLQTDAPINPGNSGGALVNTNGEVIGINSAIATSGDSTGNIGLGFAIPSDKVKTVVDSLMKGEKVSHPALGVSVTEGEDGGALVSQVTSGSAADKAGIEQGDVITKAGDKAINDSDDLIAAVQASSVGQTIAITFTRNGKEQTVNATLAEAS